MLDIDNLKSNADGRWLSIFDSLCITVPLPPGKHGKCPICNDGDDRFRLDRDTKRGSLFCNQCCPQAGDGWALVQGAKNVDFIGAAKLVQEIIGGCKVENTFNTCEQADPKIALREIWKNSEAYTGTGIIKEYFEARGLKLLPNNIRFSSECYESDTKKCYPAMLGIVQNKEGAPVTIHRTYLEGSKKADIQSPKKLMPGVEKLCGVSVRLFIHKNDLLGIAEGIETAIAATQLFNIPTWAAINSTLLTTWEPPEGTNKIVIFGDNDKNFTGHKASYILANKLFLKGFTVDVQIPDEIGFDWNDVLLKHKG